MAMDRGNPFRSVLTLREAMDRLLEDAFVQPHPGNRQGAGFPIDMIDRGDHFLVRASLAGVNPDDLLVQVQGETLTIGGHVHLEEERGRWLVHEHPSGELRRVLSLPHAVEAERAEAQFEHGMLTLTLPKLQRPGPHQIKIAGGGAHARRAASGHNPSLDDPTKPEVAPGVFPSREPSLANTADAPVKDAVTKDSEESFPASDPPSWTPERS